MKGISSIARYNEDTDQSLEASPKPGFNNSQYLDDDGEIPDEIPSFASMETVKAVCVLELLIGDINDKFNLFT